MLRRNHRLYFIGLELAHTLLLALLHVVLEAAEVFHFLLSCRLTLFLGLLFNLLVALTDGFD